MPRIYIGTYAKYNDGSIAGAWLDLDDFADRGAFFCACAVLHSDEEDPELMFQDWEDIPDRFITECSLDDDLWPHWIDKDDDTRARYQMAWDNVDSSMTPDQIDERYAGEFDDEEDWAYQYWDDCGMLQEVPEYARNYIDFKAYARDCELGGDVTFVREMGRTHVFMNN